MSFWQPIETAPETGEFLAERQTVGEWLRVVRNPRYPGDQSVVNPQTGLMWCPLRWMPFIPPVTREEAKQPSVVIDLDKADFKALCAAALESSWMPPEYMRNDWISDCCRFLREGPRTFDPVAVLDRKEIATLVHVHRNNIGHYAGFALVQSLEAYFPLEDKS